MLKKIVYPRCANTFRNWCLTNSTYEKVYCEIGEPSAFDVTLRDGLQSLIHDKQLEFTTNDKLKIYHNIIFTHKPRDIEIGSIVSEKVLPIFKDSIDLFNKVTRFSKINIFNDIENPNNYIVIPNQHKLKTVVNNPEMNHFSFITSTSNSFQLKNTKMNLEESDKDLQYMLYELDNNKYRTFSPIIKVYVSCINECPIEGKIDSDIIINRILKLNAMNINNICLSDTCGTLTSEDFEYLIDNFCYFGLLSTNKLSLHLHVKHGRESEIEKIIHKALDYKIINFDVSLLDSGGCSVTIDKNNLSPNLSYELYYKSLCNYIIKKSQLV